MRARAIACSNNTIKCSLRHALLQPRRVICSADYRQAIRLRPVKRCIRLCMGIRNRSTPAQPTVV